MDSWRLATCQLAAVAGAGAGYALQPESALAAVAMEIDGQSPPQPCADCLDAASVIGMAGIARRMVLDAGSHWHSCHSCCDRCHFRPPEQTVRSAAAAACRCVSACGGTALR